jgi:hypothetical protein
MMQKHMILSDGVARVEAKAPMSPDKTPLCNGCDFYMTHRNHLCHEAVQGPSKKAFGGDCVSRNVIYIKADPQPVKAEG